MLFLTISKGCSADDARPILAVSDQLFVERVLNSMFSLATQGDCDGYIRDDMGPNPCAVEVDENEEDDDG